MSTSGATATTFLDDGSQLFQNLELAADLLDMLFTIYDICDVLQPPNGKAAASTHSSSSSSSFSAQTSSAFRPSSYGGQSSTFSQFTSSMTAGSSSSTAASSSASSSSLNAPSSPSMMGPGTWGLSQDHRNETGGPRDAGLAPTSFNTPPPSHPHFRPSNPHITQAPFALPILTHETHSSLPGAPTGIPFMLPPIPFGAYPLGNDRGNHNHHHHHPLPVPIPSIHPNSTHIPESAFHQQARNLEVHLDRFLEAYPHVIFLIDAFKLFKPDLVHRLVLEVWEKAAVDDHLVAYAVQEGMSRGLAEMELPEVTRCQRLVQNERFWRVLSGGIDTLGEPGEVGPGIPNKIYRVIAAFIRQVDIDFNREVYAWRSGEPLPDRTRCQSLVDHPLFFGLFATAKYTYYGNIQARLLAAKKQAEAAARSIPRVECTGCCDEFEAKYCLKAPCGHSFCATCVEAMVASSMKDEASFPPRCCSKAMNPSQVRAHLQPKLRGAFAAKCFEFSVLPMERVYCPTPACNSRFIGTTRDNTNSGRDPSMVQCKQCGIGVCTRCKSRAHPGDDCQQNLLMAKVRELAAKERWRECPKCHAIIDKTDGCNHMLCRCGQQFCYRCGVAWKKCSC